MPAPGNLVAPYGVTPVYPVHTNGQLWQYEHNDPAGGSFTWGSSKQIGNGWQGRVLAGPSGYFYSITTGGELRLLHFNGSSWDPYASGVYQVIGQGWNYIAATTKYKITVDEDGVIYTLETDGRLRAWYFDVMAKNWTILGATLATGLGSTYNAIIGAGRGVLYLRTTAGVLHRWYIDDWTTPATPTFQKPTTSMSTGWTNFKNFSSSGGDVIYVVNASGTLLHYKWNTSTSKLTAGTTIGSGWGSEQDVIVSSNTTTRSNPATAFSSLGPNDGGAALARINAVKLP
ncbi:tachylectin-related carbohydrate-binding protein [Actinosynnema sp. NPDC020468]|uniref:tachylectin-related carbohydrate-binding protein n=1 Tax=Actinosynnema sp. NPDC020468 TaxID=3154488 RepID=UPI0033D68FB3